MSSHVWVGRKQVGKGSPGEHSPLASEVSRAGVTLRGVHVEGKVQLALARRFQVCTLHQPGAVGRAAQWQQ